MGVSFFHRSSTPVIYTLSLHDALPISAHPVLGDRADHHGDLRDRLVHGEERDLRRVDDGGVRHPRLFVQEAELPARAARSEEHTSELQSQSKLVCRLLLEKKNKTILTM